MTNQLQSEAAWGLPSSSFRLVSNQGGFDSLGCIRYDYTSGTGWTNFRRGLDFSVDGNKEYYTEVRLASGSGPYNVHMQLVWLNGAGETVGTPGLMDGTGSVDSGTTVKTNSFTAPSGAKKAYIRYRVHRGDTQGNVNIGNIVVRAKNPGSTLITPYGVTSDLVSADTMKALNGRFVDLSAANINVGDGELGTLKLAGNAVTVQAVQTRTSALPGNGGWRVANSLTYTLPYDGNISIDWYGSQFYGPLINKQIGVRVLINGVVRWSRLTGEPAAMQDWMAVGWAFSLSAGTHTIRVDWQGKDNIITLRDRTLKVQGAMR